MTYGDAISRSGAQPLVKEQVGLKGAKKPGGKKKSARRKSGRRKK